jgi:predicted nucleic acid-binding protein
VKILIDANILIRIANPVDPGRIASIDALDDLLAGGHEPVLVPQVLYEFWVVATRPVANNGLEMTVAEAEADLSKFCDRFEIVSDSDAIFAAWRELVTRHAVVGKLAHDARLVAAMLSHGITHILTFNDHDFSRFHEIVVVNPTAADNLPLPP